MKAREFKTGYVWMIIYCIRWIVRSIHAAECICMLRNQQLSGHIMKQAVFYSCYFKLKADL